VNAAWYRPPDRKAANVALHGDIRINNDIIGYWYAQRVEEVVDPDGEHLYICRYGEERGVAGGVEIWSIEFTVSHRYSDGAGELARKVLQGGEGGW
jgi:hypothetical protein